MTDLFEAPQTDVDYVKVMTDKFKNDKGELDTNALAKGKFEADKHIETLQSELAELRNDLKTRLTLEDALTKLTQERTPNAEGTTPVTNQEGNNQNGSQLTEEVLERLVNDKLSKAQQKAIQDKNVDLVRTVLTEKFGNGYADKLREIARDTGMTEDEVREMARNRPQALIRLAGEPVRQASPDVTPPRTSNTARGLPGQSGVQNKAYWDKMRKEQPALYHSQEMSIQRHNAAIKLGEAYFN